MFGLGAFGLEARTKNGSSGAPSSRFIKITVFLLLYMYTQPSVVLSQKDQCPMCLKVDLDFAPPNLAEISAEMIKTATIIF